MDEQRFDGLAKAFASRSSRRQVLGRILGLGVGAGGAAMVLHGTEAARRGYSGPKAPVAQTPAPDLCAGVNCDPPNACYLSGTCSPISGTCVYTLKECGTCQTCGSSGECEPVVCNTPPDPLCYATPGYCDEGTCRYTRISCEAVPV
ncbi:MAG: hypothetical protein JNM64_00825 [Chloroflexia bacterium]|nr:hypothetical protein [Chloroflexia bacterium]